MSERLRKIVEAATPPFPGCDCGTCQETMRRLKLRDMADAFDPPTVLALLAVVDAARGAIRELFRSAEAGSVERLEDALAALDALEAERAK